MDKNLIDEIRKSVNIVDVISNYLPLSKKGKNYFGVCPFHDDHSPSMSVSEEKQIYTCFSCGASGNVFKFIQDYENVSFWKQLRSVRINLELVLVMVKKKEIIRIKIIRILLCHLRANGNYSKSYTEKFSLS